MADLSKFRALSARDRVLVGIAVLLDGHDAIEMLKSDKEKKNLLCRAAKELVDLPIDLRLPLCGTLMRTAMEELA